MKKIAITLLCAGLFLFADPLSMKDDEYAGTQYPEENIRDHASIGKLINSVDFSLSSSMTIEDSIEVEFVEVVRDFIADTTSISYKRLDGTNPYDDFQNLPHGIVVDREGKMWVGFYGGLSREFQCDDGRIINLRAMHCFMPDGSPAPFSPMEFFDFPDSTKDTLYYESVTTGSCRGLTMLEDGNILLTTWSTLMKIDYQNGQGLAKWHPAMNGFACAAMTEAAEDPDQGLIYVGYVTDQKPVFMLDEDLNYIGIAIDTVPTLHRSILTRTKSDGISQIFSGSIWDGMGIFVYESSDPRTEKFTLVDTLANEVVTSGDQTINYLAWPSCLDWYDKEEGILLYGNLYCALALSNTGEAMPAKHASRWSFLDVDDNRQLGSFGIKTPSGSLYGGPYGEDYPGGSYSPRGAAFVDDYIYTMDFNLHLLQKWQIMDFADTLMLSLTVSDSTENEILKYGWANEATDGFDAGLDEEDSLITPDGTFEAHFNGELITSMKAPTYRESINWCFSFREGAGNGPVRIEWDNTAFPNYGYFFLRDTIDGSLINVNMRDTSVYIVNADTPSSLEVLYFYKLMAEFSADTVYGKSPMTVSFNDKSVGSINDWTWNLGDGTVSTEKNPVHTYTIPGIYDVSLIVSDGENVDEVYKTSYIQVAHSDYPEILEVEDVPNDQGGWVLVDFRRSGYDTAVPGATDSSSSGVEMYSVEISENGNDWVSANTTVAYGSDIYTVMVNTFGDSSATSSAITDFRVVASMMEGNYPSSVRIGYSVDNIAPPAPGELSIEKCLAGIDLRWMVPKVEDIKHYNIYRSLNEDFNGNEEIYAMTDLNHFTDCELSEDNTYFYRITAVDIHDNEGKSSETVSQTVGLEDMDPIPDTYELVQNYPNPFNPTTTLTYGLPEIADVKIIIFDISGRMIMKWDMDAQRAGWHHVIWNGRNINGDQVSTGMYIYKLYAGDYSDTKKMVLVK